MLLNILYSKIVFQGLAPDQSFHDKQHNHKPGTVLQG